MYSIYSITVIAEMRNDYNVRTNR